MKLLFFQWNAFMQKDIERIFRTIKGLTFDCVSYEFKNPDEDSLFSLQFPKWLLRDNYDAVFSLNFFPLVSDLCEKYNIPYISWVYDSPMNIRKVSSIGNHINKIYVFDRGEYNDLSDLGYTTVKHLPLGCDTHKIDSMDFTDLDYDKYSSDISFVGKLYSSDFDYLYSPLPDFLKGKLDSIINEQLVTYGCYILSDRIDENLIVLINSYHKIIVGKKELEFALACEVTKRERLLVLQSLSQKYSVKLYSNEKCNINNVINMGTAKYYSEMPKIFKLSRINLNITLKIIKTGMPLRTLDILGAGGLLMSNYQKELAENFTDGKDILMYRSVDELINKTEYYLTHEKERQQIAINGHIRASQLFELETMLKIIISQTL